MRKGIQKVMLGMVTLITFLTGLSAQSYIGHTQLRSQFDEASDIEVFESLEASGSIENVAYGTDSVRMTITDQGFNNSLVEFKFKFPLDLSVNAPVSIIYKGADWSFADNTDMGGFFKFVLIDANGATTGYDWDNGGSSSHFRWDNDVPPASWDTITMSFDGASDEGFDYTQIQSLRLVSRYHDGSWGGGSAKMSGVLTFKSLIVGSPNNRITAASASANFNNDLSPNVIASVTNKNGDVAVAEEGAAKVAVVETGFNDKLIGIELISPVDLTDNSNLYIRYKAADWSFADNTDMGGFFKFVLVDANGVSTGYDWDNGGSSSHFRWDANTAPANFITFSCSYDGTGDDGIDYTQIKKVLLVSRYHDGSWGGGSAKMSGTLFVDEITLGAPDLANEGNDGPFLTWCFFHNPFEGTELDNEHQTFSHNDAVTATQEDGKLTVSFTELDSYADIFSMELASTIDISTASNLMANVAIKGYEVTSGEQGVANFSWYLTDEAGNSTKRDAWETWMDATEMEATDVTFNMAARPQDCDLTKIKKISLRNQSANPDWSPNQVSSTLVLDFVKVGRIKLAASEIDDTWFSHKFTEKDLLDDDNQTTLGGKSVTLVQEGGMLTATMNDAASFDTLVAFKLKRTIDLNLAKEPKFSVKLLPDVNENTNISLYLIDAEGTATPAQTVNLSDTLMVDFEVTAGDADLSKIETIMFANNDAVIANGAISMDSLFVGDVNVKVVMDKRTHVVAAVPNANPVIDGDADEVWGDISAVALDRYIYWKDDYSADPAAENISGNFKVLYTADSIYYFIDITDDSNSSVTEGGASYNYDGIELYLNPDLTNDVASGAYGDDAVQIGISRKDTSYSDAGQQGTVAYAFAVKEKEANGYTAEVAVSIEGLGIEAEEAYTLGAEIAVIDADIDIENNERTRKIIWNMDLNLDIAWKNTNAFGFFELGAIPSAPVTITVDSVKAKMVYVSLNPAVDGLTADNFSITKDDIALTLKEAQTDDAGLTYSIESRNSFAEGEDYLLTTTMLGYDFGDAITFQYVPVGVNDNELIVSYGPNPVTDFITITGNGIHRVTVCDISGRVVKQAVVNSNQAVIDVQSLNSGILIIAVESATSNYTFKAVKK